MASQLQTPTSSALATFTIEGNIGSGKSTLLNILQHHFPSVVFIPEPVECWKNIANKGVNMLEKYYEDQKRWGLTFLTYAMFSRIREYNTARSSFPSKVIISERSTLSDRHVFLQMMREIGILDHLEQLLFLEMFQGFQEIFQAERPKIIYLRCCPETCRQRSIQRGRKEEASIPIQYFEVLHSKHESWVQSESKGNVLIVDTNPDLEEMGPKIQGIVDRVAQFIGVEPRKP